MLFKKKKKKEGKEIPSYLSTEVGKDSPVGPYRGEKKNPAVVREEEKKEEETHVVDVTPKKVGDTSNGRTAAAAVFVVLLLIAFGVALYFVFKKIS